MTNAFCVRCGSTNKKMVGALCIDCFLELYGLVNLGSPIEVVMCPKCYSIKVRGRWVKVSSYEEFIDIVRTIIRSSLKPSRNEVSIENIDLPYLEPFQHKAEILVRARVSGHLIEKRLVISLTWRKELCNICFRRAAGNYQAVVQVRFVHETNDLEAFKEELFKMFPDDIIEIEEMKGGFDVKVSSDHVARRIAMLIKRRWRVVKTIESYGDQRRRRDGKKTGRLYISVRVLNYREGDYIVVNKKAYIVEKLDSNTITLRDSSGRIHKIRLSELVKGVSKR